MHRQYSKFRHRVAKPFRWLLAPILQRVQLQSEARIEPVHAKLNELQCAIRELSQTARAQAGIADMLHREHEMQAMELRFAHFRSMWKGRENREDYFSHFLLLQCDCRDLHPLWGINLGDYVQAHAVKGMMQKIAPTTPISYSERDNLSLYKGPKAFTVMQGWFSHGVHFFPNDRIWPVYAGFHVTRETQDVILTFLRFNPDYFDGHQIGCRDRETLDFFQRIGIDAYLSRCYTLTFPRRSHMPALKKVFLVDVPEWVHELLPESIREGAEIIEQRSCKLHGDDRSYYFNQAEEYALLSSDLLARYRDEATLIVTTALHCASPCTAMGIPVVLLHLAGDETTRRFDFISDILPIYNGEDLRAGRVNWEPQAPDIESLKADMELNLRLTIEQERTGIENPEIEAVRQRVLRPALTLQARR